jgi:hypothetical protein
MLGNDESIITVATIKANRGMSCILSALIDMSDFHTKLLLYNIFGSGNNIERMLRATLYYRQTK